MFAALLVCRMLCAVLRELVGLRAARKEDEEEEEGPAFVCCIQKKKGPFQRQHFWQVISHLCSSTLTCTLESAHNQKMVLNGG